VSDYKPKTVATQKIKKTGDTLTLELERSIDILATLGQKKVHQLLIGFAAESENHLENARGKLIRKNADVIVVNDLAHFNQQLHQATVITAKTEISLPKVAKAQLAQQLWQEFLKLI
ncbi:MAG: phosphopantothenoylcysteine decarboxylase, partial [Culicoidibacterales bacterium]